MRELSTRQCILSSHFIHVVQFGVTDGVSFVRLCGETGRGRRIACLGEPLCELWEQIVESRVPCGDGWSSGGVVKVAPAGLG